MKKVWVLLGLSVFLFGCGATADQSEFWKHDSLYKNWDHTKFSLSGYRSPMQEDQKKSMEQGWWGIEAPYIPAK
jgi:hypothetical protein